MAKGLKVPPPQEVFLLVGDDGTIENVNPSTSKKSLASLAERWKDCHVVKYVISKDQR